MSFLSARLKAGLSQAAVAEKIGVTVTDISTLNGRTMLNTSRCGVIDARDVGKTVFLTREEAEKALEAMKDGNS